MSRASQKRPPASAAGDTHIHRVHITSQSQHSSRLPREASPTAPRHYRGQTLPRLKSPCHSSPPYSSSRPFDIKSCHGAEQRHAAPTIIVMSIDPPPRSHHSPAQLSRSHPVWDRTASWTFSALGRARLRWTSSAQVVVRVVTYSGAR